MKKKFAGLVLGLVLAGCSAVQMQEVLSDGQLVCAKATADGPLVAAIVNTVGVPVLVTNMTSAWVAAACKTWDSAAVPVSPPATVPPTVAIVPPTT